MSITVINETNRSMVLTESSHENESAKINRLLQKLESILSVFQEEEDTHSLKLFEWGVRVLTIAEVSEFEPEGFEEMAKSHLTSLDEMLDVAKIQSQFLDSEIPVEIQVHEFAMEMFLWLEEAKDILLPTPSQELVEYTIQDIDFGSMDPSMAVVVYHLSIQNANQKLQTMSLRKQEEIFANQNVRVEQVAQSLKEQFTRGKEEIERHFREKEALVIRRINLMREEYLLEIQSQENRIGHLSYDLRNAKKKLSEAESRINLQEEQIRQDRIEKNHLRNRIVDLEWESDRMCAIQ